MKSTQNHQPISRLKKRLFHEHFSLFTKYSAVCKVAAVVEMIVTAVRQQRLGQQFPYKMG
jgi:Cu/Ag efflux pump CusA